MVVTAGHPRPDREPELLLERERELAAAAECLERARAGSGSLVVVEGPPGIGKTALVEGIRAEAAGMGMGVLSAWADELEREFSFGLVRLLFEPAVRRAAAAERVALLDGAAGFAAPVVTIGSGREPAESPPAFDAAPSVLHGLYWLVSNLAERTPHVLAVDDAHWADTASLRFLLYLARRLAELPVVLIVAVRSTDSAAAGELLTRLRATPGARVLRPGPLSDKATEQLVRALISSVADREFCAACRTATGGNPFLLSELTRMLRDQAIEPTAAHTTHVREMVPDVVSRTVLVRLLGLAPAAVRIARAVALLGTDADLRHAAALAQLDENPAAAAVDALVASDILAYGQPLTFVHPMVQEVVKANLPPGERSVCHRRAARLLAMAGRPADRVATQLLSTEPAGDVWVVGALREAAHQALARGSPELASRYLARALAEPPDGPAVPDLVLELGAAQARAGDNAALDTLERAMRLAKRPQARARIAVALARALGMTGDHRRALTVLARAADEVGGFDTELALSVEAEWITVARLHPTTRSRARARSARLRARAHPPRAATSLLLANLALDALEDGKAAESVRELASAALTGGWLLDEESFGFSYAANALIWIDEYDLAERAWEAAWQEARARGSPALSALASGWRCQLAFRRGELLEAEAEGQIAVRLVAQHDWEALRGYPHAKLSDAVMERGDLAAASELLVGDTDAEQIPFFLDSRGRLKCLRGDFAAGLDDFLRCGEALEERGGRDSPGIVPWRSNAAVAYACLHEVADARRLACIEVRLARAVGAPRAIGIALRSLGLAEAGEPGLDTLREAVAVLERSQARLELARALIDLGAALRRSRHRERSRDPLRRGLDLAHRCGGRLLADRAHAELLAAGARPRRRLLSGVDALTASERRVAELAGQGLSNRQIAQSLFISMKTVAVHLTHTYQKLGVTGRADLAEIMHKESLGL